MSAFYFTPVVVKRYRSELKKEQFLKGLRKHTREPFFDNRSDRRLETEDGRMFLNEYDNYSFLSPENAFRTRWTVHKTMIHVAVKKDMLLVTTISYPSGLSGLIYGFIALSFTLIYGIYEAFSEGRLDFLVGFCFLYLVTMFSANEDYRKQNNLIAQVLNKPEQDSIQ